MTDILSSIVSLMVGGITQLGQGIGAGVKATVTALFLETSGSTTTLSTFGQVAAIFAGISLAVGITTLLFNWVRSWGN